MQKIFSYSKKTVAFFEKNNYFNYPKEYIKFFTQEDLPLLNKKGKLILGEDGLIKLASEGNGGIFYSMAKKGIIDDMKSKNIKWIFPSDFIPIKSNVLYDALLLQHYSCLKNLYPDMNEAFIKRGSPYNIKAPVSSCIALALKGYPHIAYMFYHLNMSMIRMVQKVIRTLY